MNATTPILQEEKNARRIFIGLRLLHAYFAVDGVTNLPTFLDAFKQWQDLDAERALNLIVQDLEAINGSFRPNFFLCSLVWSIRLCNV